MQTREINVLVLAYLGDTIYENYKHFDAFYVANADSNNVVTII